MRINSFKNMIRSPFGVIIFITFLIAILTLFIQLSFLHSRPIFDSNDDKDEKIIKLKQTIFDIDTEFEEKNFDKCKQLVNLYKEIDDLKAIKYSFLTELANIEAKRNKLLDRMDRLKNSIDYFKAENDKLYKRNRVLKYKILAQLYKLDEYSVKSRNSFNLINSLQIYRNFSSNQIEILNQNIDESDYPCTIEDCFDFQMCKLNQKLSIYLFGHSLQSLNTNDSNQLEYSINFVNDETKINQTCLVVIYLKHKSDLVYYVNLLNFLLRHNNEINNLLLIDLNGCIETSNRKNFIKYFMNLEHETKINEIERQKLVSLLSKSIVASFTYLKFHTFYNNMFLHFSFIISQPYLIEHANITNYLIENQKLFEKRTFLISYHQKSSDFNKNKIDILKSQLNFHYKNFNFDIDFNCQINSSENDFCYDLQKRIQALMNSVYTLIMPTEDNKLWSTDLTYRLIEALKCSTIPVLIDSDLKLPLENLIAWDEIVIRVPFSRINYLIPILASIQPSDLANRQIKARNVYNSYFSSFVNQFNTLFAALRETLSIPAVPIPDIQADQILDLNSNSQPNTNNSIQIQKQSNSDEKNNMIEFEDGEDDSYFEFLGQPNQIPLESDSNIKNFSQNKYLKWNKLYYPFNSFSSLPYDTADTTELTYVNSYSDKLNQLNYSIRANLNEADFDLEFNSSINFDEYSNLKNFTYGGGDGKFFNHYLGGNYKEEQFTIVILTYKRETILIKNLELYLKAPYLNSIVIVWNDIENGPSDNFKVKFNLFLQSKRLKIIKSKRNSLQNRFMPYELIKTDCILSLDDDTQLRLDEIMLGFRVWRENRDRLVGYPARYHSWDYRLNNYIYQSYTTCEYSMVLTGAAFYHKFYNYAYWYLMNERIRLKIDEVKNCEDIAFNMLVSHLTRKPPLKVAVKWRFLCKECENQDDDKGLSFKVDHYIQRTECIQYFISVFGYNPLLYSQYRADSVLYKAKVPEGKQKCFDFV